MSTAVFRSIDNNGYVTDQWASLAAGETGQAVDCGGYPQPKTVQIEGTFDGATVSVQGSVDGLAWHPMSTIELAAGIYVLLTGISAATLATIIENPRYMRVVTAGGGGSVALRVTLGYASLR
jgi:hypothetical protein